MEDYQAVPPHEKPEAERRPEPINGLLWIFAGGVFVGLLIGVLL